MKKLVSILLVLTLALGCCSFAAAEEPVLRLSVLGRQRSGITFEQTQSLHAWEVLCDMFRANNLELDYTVVERDQYAAILNAVMASGDFPDFFYAASLSDADCINLIEGGKLLDINEALQYSSGPAAREFAEDGLYAISAAMYTYTDGGMYFFGNVSKQISVENDYFGPQAVIGNNCAMLIRQDWLDQLGLPMPATLDEVFDTLVAFQDNDMNGNGIRDERLCLNVGGTGDNTNYMFNGVAQWFGLAPFDFQVNRQTHQAQVPFLQEGYVEYIRFIQKCVDAHVLYLSDNVSYYNGGTSEGDALNTIMQDNCVAMYYGVALSDHPYQPESAVYAMMPAIRGTDKADPAMNASSGYKAWSRWAFSADADPKAVAAFLDTICTQEYAKWVTFGIEGETYTVDQETGCYTFTASNVVDDILKTGKARGYMLVIDSYLPDASQIGWYQAYNGALNWNSYDEFLSSAYFQEVLSKQYTENQIKNLTEWCHQAETTLLYNFNPDLNMIAPMNTLEEAEVLDLYNTDLNTYLPELTVGFVSGQYDIADYDSYVEELNGMGLQEVLAVRQAQYDRYYGQ
ncbi:MAG: hypothetical protein ACI4O7_06670 [Aristaeellaceae bacterium]